MILKDYFLCLKYEWIILNDYRERMYVFYSRIAKLLKFLIAVPVSHTGKHFA